MPLTLYYQPEQCGVYLSGYRRFRGRGLGQGHGGAPAGRRLHTSAPTSFAIGRMRLLSSRPLTGEELAYFNNDFFNGEMTADDGRRYINLHNQFITCLYAGPRRSTCSICSTTAAESGSAPSQEELEQLGGASGGRQSDLSHRQVHATADMDAFLL